VPGGDQHRPTSSPGSGHAALPRNRCLLYHPPGRRTGAAGPAGNVTCRFRNPGSLSGINVSTAVESLAVLGSRRTPHRRGSASATGITGHHPAREHHARADHNPCGLTALERHGTRSVADCHPCPPRYGMVTATAVALLMGSVAKLLFREFGS